MGADTSPTQPQVDELKLDKAKGAIEAQRPDIVNSVDASKIKTALELDIKEIHDSLDNVISKQQFTEFARIGKEEFDTKKEALADKAKDALITGLSDFITELEADWSDYIDAAKAARNATQTGPETSVAPAQVSAVATSAETVAAPEKPTATSMLAKAASSGKLDFELKIGASDITKGVINAIIQSQSEGELPTDWSKIKGEIKSSIESSISSYNDSGKNIEGAHLIVTSEGTVETKSKIEYYDTMQSNKGIDATKAIFLDEKGEIKTDISYADLLEFHKQPTNRLVGEYAIVNGRILFADKIDETATNGTVTSAETAIANEYKEKLASAGITKFDFEALKTLICNAYNKEPKNKEDKFIDSSGVLRDTLDEAREWNQIYSQATNVEKNNMELDENINEAVKNNPLLKILKMLGFPVEDWLKEGGFLGDIFRSIADVKTPSGSLDPLTNEGRKTHLTESNINTLKNNWQSNGIVSPEKWTSILDNNENFSNSANQAQLKAQLNTATIREMNLIGGVLQNFEGTKIREADLAKDYVIIDVSNVSATDYHLMIDALQTSSSSKKTNMFTQAGSSMQENLSKIQGKLGVESSGDSSSEASIPFLSGGLNKPTSKEIYSDIKTLFPSETTAIPIDGGKAIKLSWREVENPAESALLEAFASGNPDKIIDTLITSMEKGDIDANELNTALQDPRMKKSALRFSGAMLASEPLASLLLSLNTSDKSEIIKKVKEKIDDKVSKSKLNNQQKASLNGFLEEMLTSDNLEATTSNAIKYKFGAESVTVNSNEVQLNFGGDKKVTIEKTDNGWKINGKEPEIMTDEELIKAVKKR